MHSRLLSAVAIGAVVASAAPAVALPAKPAVSVSAGPAALRAPTVLRGTLPASLPAILPGSILVNGSFETGDFTGWAQVNDTSFTGVDCSGGISTDGSCGAFFGPTDPIGGGIVQTLATTPGQRYLIEYDLENLGGTPNAFGFFWDGAFVSLSFDLPAFPYTTISTSLIASGAATDIAFIFFNLPSFFLLDNISVVPDDPVPAPASLALFGLGLALLAARRRAA